jgi:hypothetical protein
MEPYPRARGVVTTNHDTTAIINAITITVTRLRLAYWGFVSPFLNEWLSSSGDERGSGFTSIVNQGMGGSTPRRSFYYVGAFGTHYQARFGRTLGSHCEFSEVDIVSQCKLRVVSTR